MAKKPPLDEHTDVPRRRPGPLVELRPGFFLNADHIVSVRVLSQEEGDVYAVLHLSNGDKQNLSRDEYSAITGEEPRLAVWQAQKTGAD